MAASRPRDPRAHRGRHLPPRLPRPQRKRPDAGIRHRPHDRTQGHARLARRGDRLHRPRHGQLRQPSPGRRTYGRIGAAPTAGASPSEASPDASEQHQRQASTDTTAQAIGAKPQVTEQSVRLDEYFLYGFKAQAAYGVPRPGGRWPRCGSSAGRGQHRLTQHPSAAPLRSRIRPSRQATASLSYYKSSVTKLRPKDPARLMNTHGSRRTCQLCSHL